MASTASARADRDTEIDRRAIQPIAETDLPSRFAALYGPRYGLVTRQAPLALPRFAIRAIASKAAMMDAGVAWLLDMLQDTADEPRSAKRRSQRG